MWHPSARLSHICCGRPPPPLLAAATAAGTATGTTARGRAAVAPAATTGGPAATAAYVDVYVYKYVDVYLYTQNKYIHTQIHMARSGAALDDEDTRSLSHTQAQRSGGAQSS